MGHAPAAIVVRDELVAMVQAAPNRGNERRRGKFVALGEDVRDLELVVHPEVVAKPPQLLWELERLGGFGLAEVRYPVETERLLLVARGCGGAVGSHEAGEVHAKAGRKHCCADAHKVVPAVLESEHQDIVEGVDSRGHSSSCEPIYLGCQDNFNRCRRGEKPIVGLDPEPRLAYAAVFHFWRKAPGNRNATDICECDPLRARLHVGEAGGERDSISVQHGLWLLRVLPVVELANDAVEHAGALFWQLFAYPCLEHGDDWLVVRHAERGTAHVLEDASVTFVDRVAPQNTVTISRSAGLLVWPSVVMIRAGLELVGREELNLRFFKAHKDPPRRLFNEELVVLA
mmetsp:Transcript_10295/g.32775  ORF Transcript_10295/g.32775 Transcript_10295/m.32775 type:complete len:344 (+) Transcript_10295:1073-2104(+)